VKNLHILAVAPEKEDFLRGVDEVLHEREIPLTFDREQSLHAALDHLSRKSFDAIVCVIERADELGLVVRLRKASPDTPLLLLADSLNSEIARWAKALGATEVLERRMPPEGFLETLRQTLDTTRGRIRQHKGHVDKTLHLAKDIAALAQETSRQIERARTTLGGASRFANFLPLLVEDSVDQAFLLQQAFVKSRLPGPTELLSNGEEAVDYLSGNGHYSDRRQYPLPTIVILDLQMPRKNGFEVLEWIRKQPKLAALPVVVLSSSSRPEDRERAAALGANLFLVKPIGFEGLIETVKAIAGYWAISNPTTDFY
jgi:CheY-like chemotaxis protein